MRCERFQIFYFFNELGLDDGGVERAEPHSAYSVELVDGAKQRSKVLAVPKVVAV